MRTLQVVTHLLVGCVVVAFSVETTGSRYSGTTQRPSLWGHEHSRADLGLLYAQSNAVIPAQSTSECHRLPSISIPCPQITKHVCPQAHV
jgi:hypothetical protein